MEDSNSNPLTMLLNMRDGCVEMNKEDLDDYFEEDDDDDDDYDSDYKIEPNIRSTVDRKKKTKSKSTKTKSQVNNELTFEEQQEIEEPVEIDLRNIHKAYGINPVENRQQKIKRQSNDFISSSIGEAYMKYIHGKEDEAINLLFEVIRIDPLSPEPYDALGDIYHKMGNYQKALEFYLLAIEFNQTDSKRWAELAEIALLNNMYKSALQFYSKAIQLSPKNITYHIRKANLFEDLKQYENSLKTCEKLMSFLEPSDYKIILSITFRMANLFINHLNRPGDGLKLIEDFIEQHSAEKDPEKFESFRLYLPSYFDVLLANDKAEKVIFKFVQYELIVLPDEMMDFDHDDQRIEAVLNYLKSGQMNFENDIIINSKLACAWLNLRNEENSAIETIEKFKNVDESILEVVFRPIIPLLIQLGYYEQAYCFASKLVDHVHSTKYWYWCGYCLRKLSRDEEAVAAYENAIKYDPNNFEAVNELSDVCNRIGIPERALDCVHLDRLKVDCRLLLNRCNLLFICKRWPEFISHTRLLLDSNIHFIEDLKDVRDMISRHSNSFGGLLRSSRSLRRKFSRKSTKVQLMGDKLNSDQFFEYWKKSIFVLLNYIKDRDEAVLWAFSGLLSNYTDQLFAPILLIIFRTCIDVKLRSFSFDIGKMLIREYMNSGQIWYAFSVMLANIYQDCRHKRVCIQMWIESSDNVNVLLMNGHLAFSSSRFIHALGIYLTVYRMKTAYRYDSFHVALTYMHLISQIHTMDKASLFSQMIYFFNDYVKKIGKCQETYYNLGRAFHQLGFTRYATELYQAALHTPLKVHDKRFDLSPEIAFNLSQIYRHSGDHRKANQLIRQYCTI